MSRWSVVVPVKAWWTAKSRLREVPGEDRRELARALALDTVRTVLTTPGVLECVVVGEAGTCADLAGSGARCVTAPDDAGLDAALSTGAALRERSARGTCFLVADLPLVSPSALGAALALVPQEGSGVVRDAAGTGTVLLAGRPGPPRPHFGPGSGLRHLRCGATDLSADVDQGLRHDLDVWEDLVSLRPRPGSHLQAWFRGVPGVRLRAELRDDLVAAAVPP